jgi:hypothetical protein
LRLPKNTFYQGEIIDAALTFANSTTNAYWTDTRNYDRSGRLSDIAFFAESQDGKPVPDPLKWYYSDGRCYFGGGLGGDEDLGRWSITLPANQWVRFDAPGKYRLYAWANRVRKGRVEDHDYNEAPVELVSDVIDINITPLAEADELRILKQAQADLAAEERVADKKAGQFLHVQTPAARKAMEQMRYLQTPAACNALLALIGREDGFEAGMGLLGAADPTREAAAVLTVVENPQTAVDRNHLWLYSSLKSFAAQQSATGGVQKVAQIIQDSMKDAQAEFTIKARAVLPKKKGPVLATSILTLLFESPRNVELREMLVAHRADLTDMQVKQIFSAWETRGTNWLGGVDFLPIVRDAALPPRCVSDALFLMARLAPDEARPIIVEDIERETPRYDVHALCALPDSTLPQFDPVFLKRLQGQHPDLSKLMPLISRYASPTLLPDVIAVYQPSEGNWACDIQAAVLKYWIRCAPRDGVEALTRAMKSREGTGCYHGELSKVLLDGWVNAARSTAIAALQDEDPEVIESAARVLERNADPSTLPYVIGAINHLAEPASKEQERERHWRADSLVRLLLDSKRWKLTREQIEQLAAATSNDRTKQLLQARIKQLDTR